MHRQVDKRENVNIIYQMIDLDEINPNWELSKAHANSTRSGKTPQTIEQAERCPCCFRVIDTQPIGVFEHIKQLQVLGLAYPLFFTFLKYVIALICFQICSYNIMELSNGIYYNQKYCEEFGDNAEGPICSIYFVRIASLEPVVNRQEYIMRICSFVVQLLILVFIRNRINKTLKYYEERQTKISDYSVIIKGMPLVLNVRQKIYRLFQQYFSESVHIEQCILIGSIQKYFELKHEKKQLFNQIRKKGKLKNQNEQQLATLIQKINKNSTQLESETQSMINSNKKDQLLCEKAIIIIESDFIKQQVIKQFKTNFIKQSKLKELSNIFKVTVQDLKLIRVIKAPEPEQIIWENINLRRSVKIVRQILGWLFTILFMAAITGLFYLIIRQKSRLVEKWSEIIDQQKKHGGHDPNAISSYQHSIIAIVYFFIFLIVFLNKFVISKFLHFISHFEKYSTYAKQEYYFSVKYTITLFLTTAVMTLLVEGITFHNIDRYEYGVVEQESIMFIINAFFIPFLWLVNPLQIVRIIRRKVNYGKSDLTQGQANNLMVDQPASLGKHFAETIQILWFTFMYSSVVPFGAIVILVGLSINYWVIKYTILRRCSVDHHISGSFITLALKLLDVSLMMQPSGELIFDYFIRDGPHISSIICLIVAAIYVLFPVDWLLEKTHRQTFKLHYKTYKEAKTNFVTNYQMLHPIYSLKKIFVEKEVERLKLFYPMGAVSNQLNLSAEIVAALRRSSWRPEMGSAYKQIQLMEIFTNKNDSKIDKQDIVAALL